MAFRTCCLLGAAITLALFVVLLTYPPLVFWLFGIDGGPSAELLTRRAAVLVLGLAVTLWLARDAQPSATRQAIALGTAVTMLGLAALGTAEFARGAAGLGLWAAILAEIGLGTAFLHNWFRHRRPAA